MLPELVLGQVVLAVGCERLEQFERMEIALLAEVEEVGGEG